MGLFTATFLLALIVFGIAVGLLVPGDPLALSLLAGTPAALGASYYLMVRIERTPLLGLGLTSLPQSLRSFGRGTVIGFLLIGATVLAMWAIGWLSWRSTGGSPDRWLCTAFAILPLLAVAAWLEELLFRGYPFQVLTERFGPAVAIVVTSLIFGAMHGANPSVTALALANITLAGALLAIAFWRSRDLWLATGLHFGWNAVMAFADLSVSGLPMEVPVIDAVLTGPTLATGGGFGPEGGLAVTVASLAGILWAARTSRLEPSLEVRAVDPPSERRAPRRPATAAGLETGR